LLSMSFFDYVMAASDLCVDIFVSACFLLIFLLPPWFILDFCMFALSISTILKSLALPDDFFELLVFCASEGISNLLARKTPSREFTFSKSTKS
jgi:hypothetical protein